MWKRARAMFTPDQRARLRTDLLERAAADPRISGAAITGSAAAEREDRWSDIDLAFGVGDASELQNVLSGWTSHMYERHGALHHVDVKSGAWIYRVFFLASTLQVDLAFVPAAEFRPLASTFRLVFGAAREPTHSPGQAPADLIGMAWLYALHARSCIARSRLWQAEFMISGVRDHGLALACVRHGLPAAHGRGMDLLPYEAAAPFEGALVRQLDVDELRRAFGVAIRGLLGEIRNIDGELAARLQGALLDLTDQTI